MTRRKWSMLRVPRHTHQLLLKIKKRAGVPMSEVVRRIVDHVYSGGPSMQALTFFMIYFDGTAMFIIAAKDAETAENGMREKLLGQKVGIVQAKPIVEADADDVMRVGIAAILSQLTTLNAVLGAAMQPPPPQGGPRNLKRVG